MRTDLARILGRGRAYQHGHGLPPLGGTYEVDLDVVEGRVELCVRLGDPAHVGQRGAALAALVAGLQGLAGLNELASEVSDATARGGGAASGDEETPRTTSAMSPSRASSELTEPCLGSAIAGEGLWVARRWMAERMRLASIVVTVTGAARRIAAISWFPIEPND